MKFAIFFLFCVGLVSSLTFTRDTAKMSAKNQKGVVVLNWHGSEGLVCATKDNAANIAKVVCKSGGETVGKGTLKFENTPEFTVSGMTCSGSEADISECQWKDDNIAGYQKCDEFVGCSVNTSDNTC